MVRTPGSHPGNRGSIPRGGATLPDARSRKAPGVNEIFLPGEIEFRKFEAMRQTGFEVSDKLASELTELSVTLGAIEEGADFGALVRHFAD